MKQGFSLVELSIVLVILGLITGGILAGQSLIRASELRSVSAEYSRYVSATQTFRDKYFAIPGDMPNAVKFWGAADGGTGDSAACMTTTTNDARTCNGDGEGRIGTSSVSNEHLRFWQHLANAGLIEGTYTGVNISPSHYYTVGTNVPRSKLDASSYWFPQWEGTHSSTFGRFDSTDTYGNTFFFGSYLTGSVYRGNLKPEEAWNLDTKMDDGKPARGKVRNPWDASYSASGTACTNAANAAALDADYLLTNPNKDCEAFFLNSF